MTQINIQRVTGAGFLTFYDAFDLHISNYEGKTLQIDGWNKDDEMSKSNGSGKSSLLEAISWGLYGELGRKNRYKDEVIYNRNGVKAKKAIVVIDFEYEGHLYRIERSVEWKKSPELIFWSDDVEVLKGSTYQVKQDHLESVLGMNFTSFQCCEMFGRDFMNFPELKPAERAKILTDIRGLEKYVLASKRCGDEIRVIQIDVGIKNEELKTIEGRINQLREIDYKAQIKQFEEDRKKKIKEIVTEEAEVQNEFKKLEEEQEKKIHELEVQISHYKKQMKENDEELKNFPALEKKNKESIVTFIKQNTDNEILKQKLQEINQEIINLQEVKVGICHVCKQKITGEHLKKEILNLHNKSNEFIEQLNKLKPKIEESFKERKKMEKEINDLSKIEDWNTKIQNQIHEAKTNVLRAQNPPEVETLKTTLTKLKVLLQSQKSTLNPYEKQEEERKTTLFKFITHSQDLKKKIKDLNTNIQYQQFWVEGFKKIKMMLFSTMIDRFQDYAQILLSQYSSELQVQFSTERETRSGTTKDEFNISITDSNGTILSYEMYSGGERQKVKLAVAIALSQTIQDGCGREFNFLAFDEPNDALDDFGKETNFSVFTGLTEYGKAVLVTDHNDFFKDKFDNTIVVIKEGDKSHIKEE